MAEKPEFTFPDAVSFNEKNDVMEVKLMFNDLKTSFGFPRKPSNAQVEEPIFKEKSLCLLVNVTDKKKKTTNYRYKIKELPFEIVPDKSSVQYKDKFITLILKKEDSERVWDYKLQEKGGLEMDGEQEI